MPRAPLIPKRRQRTAYLVAAIFMAIALVGAQREGRADRGERRRA